MSGYPVYAVDSRRNGRKGTTVATIVRHTLPVVDAIRERADQLGLSTRAVGEALGVSASSVSNWYRGNYTPPLTAETQAAIARFLEVSPRRVVELYELDLSSDEHMGGSLRSTA